MLRLSSRYYRTIPITHPGYQYEVVSLDQSRTALVIMHCWNIGCQDGPPIDPRFWVGMGFPDNFIEAKRIMKECIRPAMDAARKAGILVCHVESPEICASRMGLGDSSGGVNPKRKVAGVVPGWRESIAQRSHGRNYATDSPLARMDRARIVEPQPGELLVCETEEMHDALANRGIENLVYAGFAADMCLLRAPGGIEHMALKDHRVILIRDATLGVECPDTFAEKVATRWAIRYFETHYGNTVTSADFVRACERALEG